jgi:hypothetical protein
MKLPLDGKWSSGQQTFRFAIVISSDSGHPAIRWETVSG